MKGFTLIELVITTTIILLLSGSSLAAFLNYRDRRVINDDAALVANRLRSVEVKATAVEVPAGCAGKTVNNYTVSYTSNTGTLTVAVNCTGSTVQVPELSLSLTNSKFRTTGTVIFDSRTVSATPATLDMCSGNDSFSVSVNASANVTKPVYTYLAGGC